MRKLKKMACCAYLFFGFTVVFSFNMLQAEKMLRMQRATKKVEAVEEEVTAKKIVRPETFGFGYLTRVRNDTKYPLQISSLQEMVKGKKGELKKVTTVTPGGTQSLADNLKIMDSKIEIKGVSEQSVEGFTVGSSVKVSHGVAFMDKALQAPNMATLTFRVLASKGASIAVVFTDKITPDYVYKIVIGAKENTQSVILKKDPKTGKEKIVFKVLSEVNPLARLIEKTYETFWIAINGGLILVGKGGVGQNVFMSYFDEDFEKNITRIGVGALKTPVNFMDIQVSPELSVQSDWQPYFQAEGSPDFRQSKGDYKFLKNPFRVPGRGTISFEAKGDEGIAVAFGDNLEYQFIIGHEANSRTILKKDDKIVASLYADACPLAVIKSPEEYQTFWFSLSSNFLLFGSGKVGENLLLAWKDPHPTKISDRVALGTSSIAGVPFKAEFKNIKLGPSIGMFVDLEKDYYKTVQDMFKYPDSFSVISPILYELFQEKQNVGVKDLALKKNYGLAKLTQHDAKYFLMLIIESNGLPKMENVRGPEPSLEVVKLAKSAYVSKAVGQYAKEVAVEVGYGAGSGIGGAIPLAGSAILGGVGAGLIQKGLKQEAETKMGYQTDDDYAFVGNVSRQAYAGVKVPEQAILNKKEIDEIIASVRTEKDIGVILAAYRNVLELINHPFVVEDLFTKKKTLSAINQLYRAGEIKKQSTDYYKNLLRLLLDARDNPYLVDVGNAREKVFKSQWYFWANRLAQDLFKAENKTAKGFVIPPFFGEYFWLPIKIKKPDQIKISFWAKALNDINVCFAKQAEQVRNSKKPIYEIVIRGWKGTRSVIRASSLGRPVAGFRHSAKTLDKMREEEETLFLDPGKVKAKLAEFKFRKYEISLNNGRIIVLEDGKKILDWQDPYPITGIDTVGLGSWNVNVSVRDVSIEAL